MSVKIKYGDVAPEAKENFNIGFSDQAEFVNTDQLKRYNASFENVGNPCELYNTVLDGNARIFAEQEKAYWSNSICDGNGTFAEPIVLTLAADGQYTSIGLTFEFDSGNGIYCNDLSIEWFRNNEKIDEADFEPNSELYFCQKNVENYDKVIVTFNSMNMPYARLKIRSIDYGYGTFFFAENIMNAVVSQKSDSVSAQIPISTVDFTLNQVGATVEYSFQKQQPVSVFWDDELIATAFIRKATLKGGKLYDITAEDYIGRLDSTPYDGGLWDGKNAAELMAEIFTLAKVPYEIDDSLETKVVSGYLPIGTCREAIMQIAFAICAVIDTSNSTVVKVVPHDDDVKQVIPAERVMQGQTVTTQDTVTAVSITAHAYRPSQTVKQVYAAKDYSNPRNYRIEFGEPIHSLEIFHGEILSSHINYAIVNVNASDCYINGKTYEHDTIVETKQNPKVLAGEPVNVKEIKDATLVTVNNVDEVIEHVYNEVVKTKKIETKIVEGKHGGIDLARWGAFSWGSGVRYMQPIHGSIVKDEPVHVGEVITVAGADKNQYTGRIESQSMNLDGNILIKSVVMNA